MKSEWWEIKKKLRENCQALNISRYELMKIVKKNLLLVCQKYFFPEEAQLDFICAIKCVFVLFTFHMMTLKFLYYHACLLRI